MESAGGMEVPGCDQLELVTQTELAQTYRAVRRLTGASVSVRVWPVGLPDERMRRRFLRDAQQASHLPHHPALARIEDAGFAQDGRPFVVTEPLPRQTLADALPVDGPMPVDAALRLGIEIAGAAAAAHDAGEVHSRIDPSVVFLAPGSALLADLGTVSITEALARAAGPAPRPRYFAAPEQLERGAVGTASDIYSLGAVVYAALAGRAPHERAEPGAPESAALVLLRTLQAELPAIDRADVPAELTAALRRALDPDPSARTASAQAFATALLDVQREHCDGVSEPADERVAMAGQRPDARAPQAGAGSPPVAAPPDLEGHWPGASPSMGPPAEAPTSPVWSPPPPEPRPRVPADEPPSQMQFHPIEDETPRRAEVPPAPRLPAQPGPPATATTSAPHLPPPRPPVLGSPTGPGHDRATAPPRHPAHSTARRRSPVGLIGGALAVAIAVGVGVAASGVLSADDPPDRGAGPSSTEAPAAVPTGLGAVESAAGVQLDWEGEATSRYAVLVMSETTAPTVLVAEDGPSLLVPSAELRAEVGYCFAVADMAALDASGGDTEAAFGAPTCIRGASEDTVRTR